MIKLLILLTLLLGLVGYWKTQYHYVIINHSTNLIEKNGAIVVPGYIVEYKEGKNHLTVTRLNTEVYKCRVDQGGFSSVEVITDNLEYRVLQIDTGVTYITESRSDYIQYLSKNNITDLLTTGNFEDANFRKNDKLKEVFKRSRESTERNVSMGKCHMMLSVSPQV